MATAHPSTLDDSFLRLLEKEQIQTVFQPIISLKNGQVHAYEALSRGPENHPFQMPDQLFSYATEHHYLWELEQLCRKKALEQFHTMQLEGKLFLNVNPNILTDQQFTQGFTKEYVEQFSITPSDLVFEITEKEAITHHDLFQDAVQHYKNQHYQVAIDDVGSGYSGLNIITDIHPHYLKLDMHLIRNIDHEDTKQSLVKSLVEFANLASIQIIAEGIETPAELLTVIRLGIPYGQGYLIAKPHAKPTPIHPSLIECILKENNQLKTLQPTKIISTRVEQITQKIRPVTPEQSIEEIEERLKKEDVTGLTIVKHNKPIGVVTNFSLRSSLSGPFGYSLFHQRPVKSVLQHQFIAVDAQTPINIVSKLAMMREKEHLYDLITVTKNGEYFGVVSVKDLLEATMQLEINFAKHLNPLSELPGNLMIEQQLQEAIGAKKDAIVLYIDIDHFKPYNDYYGFEAGDEVIMAMAQILKKVAHPLDFIGHIGGDDFILMTTTDRGISIAKEIIRWFDHQLISHYRPTDFENGFITSNNRKGVQENFPLISLSIVGVNTRQYSSFKSLSEDASYLKKKCKQIKGSHWIINEMTTN